MKFGKLNLAAKLKVAESDRMEADAFLLAKLQNELGSFRASAANKAKEAELSISSLGSENKTLKLELDGLKKMANKNDQSLAQLAKLTDANKKPTVDFDALKLSAAKNEKSAQENLLKLTAANRALSRQSWIH